MTIPRRPRRPRRPVSETVHPLARINTRRWERLRDQVVREEPICWLKLPGCRLRSETADHVRLRKTHPHLTYERSNLRGACKPCNMRRGDTPHWKIPQLRATLEAKTRPAKALGFFR